MATITTPPRGLISLFGLRDMGAVPADLAEQVVSTIDITEFALTNRESLNIGSAGVNTVGLHLPAGGSIDPTVPPGELWYVHQFSINTLVIGAGASLRVRPVLVDSTIYYSRGAAVAGVAGEAIMTASDRMFLATPGQSLRIWCEAVGGGGATVFANALVTRLRI